MAQVDMSDYVDVAERLAEFRAKHPDGSLQPADVAQPFTMMSAGDQTFVVYVAAAYRTPDDTRPGIGAAWEQFPGRTPYTRGSELQNAETSAWGRAIVAALAADTKRGIATAQDVRNARAEDDDTPRGSTQGRGSRRTPDPVDTPTYDWRALFRAAGFSDPESAAVWIGAQVGRGPTGPANLPPEDQVTIAGMLTAMAATEGAALNDTPTA
jgi:hypothetical protein